MRAATPGSWALPAAALALLALAAAGLPARAGASWAQGVAIVVWGSQYGTGWWVAKNTLVTAAHVVGWENNATVTVIRGEWKTTGRVVYVDTQHDVAVIETSGMPKGNHIFPIASRVDELKTLYVIGYPYELIQLSKGDLAAASSDPRIARGFAAWYNHKYQLIEFQATTDAGNSGGPVVYANGAVAGLVSFAVTGKAGTLYFASDANALRRALDAAGVRYSTLDPPLAESAPAQPAARWLGWGFWAWSAVVSALVSIVVTAAWLAARG